MTPSTFDLPKDNPGELLVWRDKFVQAFRDDEAKQFQICYEVLDLVNNELSRIDSLPSEVAKNYLSNVLYPVVATIRNSLQTYEGTERTVVPVLKSVRLVSRKLDLATRLYPKESSPYYAKRIDERLEALDIASAELADALSHWYKFAPKPKDSNSEMETQNK